MNAPLPQPTEPTKSNSSAGGVSAGVSPPPASPPKPSPALPPATYKPGKMPAVKASTATATSPALPKVPNLNTPPIGVTAAKPLGQIPPKPQLKPLAQPKTLAAPPNPNQPGKKIQPASGKESLLAKAKKDPKKLILMGLAGLFIVVLVAFGFSKLFGGGSKNTADVSGGTVATQPTKQTTITYWGLWESSAVLEEVIGDFETANPGLKVDYRVQSHKDYRERLQTAIASGNGPDAFRYHASWVPMLSGDLAILPANVMNAADFKASFYPVVSEQLQIDGKIVGIPLMYDGLGLYYNKEVLETAGVEPPTTWAELKQLANELTVPADKKERDGGLQRGGLAIGNASNVEHYSDILGLLILQNGGDPLDPAQAKVKDALTFYTNFIKQDKVWDSSLPSSTVAFARGEAVMMLAPSWRAHEIMELSPDLEFGIASLPQLSDEKIALASYWAEGVNEKSKNKNEAWTLLKYLSSAEVMKKLYSVQAQTRAFGEPYSRVDLTDDLASDPYVGAILSDANFATGIYMNSFTHDNGINDQVNEYYIGAIDAFLQGEDQDEALSTLENGVIQVLRQYQ